MTPETRDYPARLHDLTQQMQQLAGEIPEVMAAFGSLHETAVADGALDTRTKELTALAIGIAVRCDGRIAFHINDAIDVGASRAEIVETIGVAMLVGGGPSVVYGCEALEALDQFTQQPQSSGPR